MCYQPYCRFITLKFIKLWDEIDVKPTLIDSSGSLFNTAEDQPENLAKTFCSFTVKCLQGPKLF